MTKMTGPEIKALRRDLDCTARDLGAVLGVDQATVLAWEREELFPTKRHSEAMRALAEKGRGAVPASGSEERPPFEALADPAVWKLFRKILAHAELRRAVEKLADEFDDPTDR